ncbi:hypothetical protein B591_07630 [Streptomyces sp. GBA 94-10 4N24]|nr:hypothetical protein B591_07630 [Streptomyces sp. GBA 94-10 4N24]UZN58529.1 hypothetical protein B591N_07630 [Streptomyces sp. GBA 94-10 4N24]
MARTIVWPATALAIAVVNCFDDETLTVVALDCGAEVVLGVSDDVSPVEARAGAAVVRAVIVSAATVIAP